jgi:glycosyltransferase involved in cell wall biosynthesis
LEDGEVPADKVLFFESHPVQYKAPVYQELQRVLPDAFEVVYATDANLQSGNVDREFGTVVVWDVPLMQGYSWRVLGNAVGKPFTSAASLSGRGVFALLARERPAAVVLTHFRYRFDQAAYLGALLLGIPILIRQETQDEMGRSKRSGAKQVARDLAYRLLYAPARHAFAFGALNYEHLCRHGLPKERITFARFSVPDPFETLDANHAASSRAELRRLIGLHPEQRLLGFFGKLIPKKSPELLLDAVRLLPAELRVRAHLVFVGSGELQPELERAAAQLKADTGVAATFAGFINQSKLPDYYLATDIAVLPSSYEETWGLVVNEALQAGCAVAVTEAVGSHREFAGLERVRVAQTGNALSLATAIEDLFSFPRELKWARPFMAGYSSAAAARGIAEGLAPYLSPRLASA